MLKPGDIEMLGTSETWGQGANNKSVRVVQATFKVRGQGPFNIAIPTTDFTAERLIEAVKAYASQIVDTLDFTG